MPSPAHPLVVAHGRTREQSALRRAYRDACEGTLRVLVVDGSDASPGPTLEAFVAEHRAGPVLRVDARRPGALERLVRDGLSLLAPVRRSRHIAGLALARPELARAELARAAADVTDLLVEAERRLRLRDAALTLLSELGEANPCVLLLEGMETAERSLLDLVGEVSRERAPFEAPLRLLLVAATEGAPSEDLAEHTSSARGRALRLHPLDHAAVRDLLSSRDVVDAVLSLTGGQPELIERLLCGEGLVRTERASAEARAGLEVLALIPGPVDDELFAALLETPVAPAELARAGAVRATGSWLLPPALRERVRASLEAERARVIHHRACEALAETAPARAARYALLAGEVRRAGELAEAGAEALVKSGAPLDAADLLSAIERAHEQAGLPIAPTVRARLAELAWVAGAHEEALRHAARACEEAPDDADAARRHGTLLALAGRHAEALAALEQARAADPSPQTAAALAEARYRTGDLEGAAELAETVEAVWLPAMNTRAKVDLARGDHEAAELRLGRVLAEAEARSMPRPACQAMNNLAIVAMGRGELGSARRWLDRAAALADASGAVYPRGIAHKNLAVVAQLEGRWSSALGHAERALALLAGLADPSLRARLAFNTADLHRSLGDPYRALRLVAYARERAGDALDAAVDAEGVRVEARIEHELGRLDAAADRWRRALDATAEGAAATEARLGLAAVELERGDTAAARELLDAVGGAPAARPAARLARLRAAMAPTEEAVPLARLALEAAAAASDPLLVQEARVELAAALGRAGLSERASEELDRLRADERGLEADVPEPLRPLFRERRLLRRAAQLELRRAALASAPNGARPAKERPMVGPTMVGASAPMRELRRIIARVAPSEGTLLVTGESGTGKELVAEALHSGSKRADAPFVRVNCAALVDELLQSELFGHERGAFTGADRQKQGRFELADGGTLLLDEIGDISPRMQAALLRVLQEGTFERVGGTQTLSVNVRVIAATHRDLAALVREGRFREDLYYRLSGITIRVPALRERLDDIPPLAKHLLEGMAHETGPRSLAPDALERLATHRWPGNVRELENVLRRAAVLGASTLLTAPDLEGALDGFASEPPPSAERGSLVALAYESVRGGEGSIYDLRKRLERELIERALDEVGGNISRAASSLA